MAEENNRTPGGLPLLDSGWVAEDWELEPGDAFWNHVSETGAQGELAANLDAAMAGKSAPRIWMILHEPGQPELSTAVALAFARELSGRDQAALILDCDDQAQSLTRWVERQESEGWIDLARYGTSVLTAGVPLPFEGRRGYLLGVGSFAPTDISAAEINELVNRLRHQADDLILVAPADAIGELWAPVANLRLLCWDRATRTADDLAGLLESLAAKGTPLSGLVGFGTPAEDVPGEADSAAADLSAAPTAAEPSQTVIRTGADLEVDPATEADDFHAAPPAAAADDAGPDGGESIDEEPGWTEAPPLVEKPEATKGTSGVFWFLASASVVIVAILGVYWYRYVRVPSEGHFVPIEVVTEQTAPVRPPGDRTTGDMVNRDDAGGGEIVAAAGTVGAFAADSIRAGTGRETAGIAAEDLSTSAPTGPPRDTFGTSTQPASTTDAAPEAMQPEPRPTTPATPTFSMAPYRTPVGADGWALHLYSFPDQAGTEAELAELHRRGFETEVRIVETQTKGRWWRVYVGNFATKAEARAAAPLIKKKLRTDWANPTRF